MIVAAGGTPQAEQRYEFYQSSSCLRKSCQVHSPLPTDLKMLSPQTRKLSATSTSLHNCWLKLSPCGDPAMPCGLQRILWSSSLPLLRGTPRTVLRELGQPAMIKFSACLCYVAMKKYWLLVPGQSPSLVWEPLSPAAADRGAHRLNVEQTG